MTVSPAILERAVRSICPDVEGRVFGHARENLSEKELWEELACCVLSSQVPFELARTAADELSRAGLFNGASQKMTGSQYESELLAVLSSPLWVGDSYRRYRFPKSKAHQLAVTRGRFFETDISLSEIVYGSNDAADSRTTLINLVAGMGAKQASMFLRNSGSTYDLAILDRHVLTYMSALQLTITNDRNALGLKRYLATEDILHGYAQHLGFNIGCLDWAIWIVMRVARREHYL